MSTAFLEDLDAHRDALDIVKAAARLRTPILVVHGEEDESVPLIEAHAIHGALPDGAHARLLTVPGAGHTFGVTHPYAGSTPEFDRVVSETLGWFRATLVREESVTPATEVGHRLPV